MSLLHWILLLVGAAVILAVSHRPLRQPGSHGFYRAFAFALILALVLVVLKRWFTNPFSPAQLISWALLVGSLVLVAAGFRQLRRHGRAQGSFENTTRLVDTGIYRYIRHPMYASLLCLAWGALLKDPGWLAAVLCAAATFFLWRTAVADESENLARFGPQYQRYMQRTRRFIPFVV